MERSPRQVWWEAMVRAIQDGLESEFVRLLSANEDLNQPPTPPPLDFPMLTIAARDGGVTFIERLLDAGAEIDRRDRAGITALHWAVKRRQLEAAKLLLRHGADPKPVADDGNTAIQWVAYYCERPDAPGQAAPDPHWIELGISMLERGADGEFALKGKTAFQECPALLSKWEREALQRKTPPATGEPRVIRLR